MVERYEVYLVALDPTIGSELKKTRPAVIISPNEVHKHLSTVIIAPLTSQIKKYPTRVSLTFQNKKGEIILEQLRTVDQKGLVKKLGTVSTSTAKKIINTLQDIFAY